MRRAGHSWSNRKKTQKSDNTVAGRIGKALLLAVVCAGFLFYTIPRMQTGAYFTATASASIDFEMTVGGLFANGAAVPDAQLEDATSAVTESGAPESKPESAASTAESTAESTAPQSEAQSRPETQSTPAQDGDAAKTESTNADVPGSAAGTGDSVQSGTES
ncbi:hypothetical protein [Caproiciproducens sp.]